jgi:natural product biosynthesis luciferase-like monooxygenase protein
MSMQFSVMFFASDSDNAGSDRYGLTLRSCQYADRSGFVGVWLPERHFHRFGGLYPNPAVVGAAIAATTARLRIRAGSVILPLNDPLRVAEEWSVVDNLSGGRVDLAFGQGWNPNDFVLQPQNFQARLELLHRGVDEVRRLWAGESLERLNGVGKPAAVTIYPRPIQPAFGLWITCSGSDQRFEEAGRAGANVLTALLFQDTAQLRRKIALYRAAHAAAGHSGRGHVTLMLHTYVGQDSSEVRQVVTGPLMRYLEDSTDLWKQDYPQFDEMSAERRRTILQFAFERYLRNHSLCGSVEQCADRVTGLAGHDVDEIACLIDFGIAEAEVLRSLENVTRVQRTVTSCTNRPNS